MQDLIFQLQRFASYVVNANADSGTYSVTKDGADTGISGSFDGKEFDLPSLLTISSGDSLTLSKSPETADVNVTFHLSGAGNYTLNGFNLTMKRGAIAYLCFDNTGDRYIYPAIGVILSDYELHDDEFALFDVEIVYNGVTYRNNTLASFDHSIGTVEFANHGSSGERIWLTSAEVVNASSGMRFYVEPEQQGDTYAAAGQLIVDGVKINYDANCEDLNFTVTDSGIVFDDDELGVIHTYNKSSGNNVVSFNIVNDNYSISESYVANILSASDGAFNYTGGNASISSYAGEKVNLVANFTGLGFNDTDFMLNSSSGSLTIQTARDKVIDVAVNNNTVAYAYLASGAGVINGGGISQLEVIIGGNNSANTITAGSGGSSLWGGIGGNDIFTGGAGQDTFFYGKNDGADIINNAGSSDIVNLYDVSLADIVSANISGSQISVGFNTGSNLQINSSENLSAKFNLANGSFKYNHSTNGWQNA